jgi:IS1 family transposase/transposase-like protein
MNMCDSVIRCPRCLTTDVKKCGLNFNRHKQQHKCKDCKYKFVDKGQQWFIGPQKQELVKKLLAERISLRGICRVVDSSLTWLLKFIKQLYQQLPDNLNCHIPIKQVKQGDRFYIKLFDNEADELWSFVRKRNNVYYIWLVIHRAPRQVIAFHVGDRSRESARALWENLPRAVQKYGLFHTDDWKSYKTVIPQRPHLYCKQKQYTNQVERFNCTLRQRCSRLVRETLSFSRTLDNHIGAIKFFLCQHNLKLQSPTTAP